MQWFQYDKKLHIAPGHVFVTHIQYMCNRDISLCKVSLFVNKALQNSVNELLRMKSHGDRYTLYTLHYMCYIFTMAKLTTITISWFCHMKEIFINIVIYWSFDRNTWCWNNLLHILCNHSYIGMYRDNLWLLVEYCNTPTMRHLCLYLYNFI